MCRRYQKDVCCSHCRCVTSERYLKNESRTHISTVKLHCREISKNIIKFVAISVYFIHFVSSESDLRRNDTVENFSRRRRRSITKYKGPPVIPGCPYICLSSMRLSGMDHHCSYRLGLSQGLMRMARPFTEIRLESPLGPLNTRVLSSHLKCVLVTINMKKIKIRK